MQVRLLAGDRRSALASRPPQCLGGEPERRRVWTPEPRTGPAASLPLRARSARLCSPSACALNWIKRAEERGCPQLHGGSMGGAAPRGATAFTGEAAPRTRSLLPIVIDSSTLHSGQSGFPLVKADGASTCPKCRRQVSVPTGRVWPLCTHFRAHTKAPWRRGGTWSRVSLMATPPSPNCDCRRRVRGRACVIPGL